MYKTDVEKLEQVLDSFVGKILLQDIHVRKFFNRSKITIYLKIYQ